MWAICNGLKRHFRIGLQPSVDSSDFRLGEATAIPGASLQVQFDSKWGRSRIWYRKCVLPLGIISPILHFMFNFYASRLPKCFIFVKKTSSVAGIFIFYQVQKFWSEKKLGHFFRDQKFSKKFRKFSKIWKIFNEKSMKIEIFRFSKFLRFSIFIDFSLKNFRIFEKFPRKIFREKWPPVFFKGFGKRL